MYIKLIILYDNIYVEETLLLLITNPLWSKTFCGYFREIPKWEFQRPEPVESWHPPGSPLSPSNSGPIQGLLSKVRRLAEILKKNYIIIAAAALSGEARLRPCVLGSHNRWPLCPSERDPYHTGHCEGRHKSPGERYFITRVFSRISFFCPRLPSTILHPPERKKKEEKPFTVDKWISL